jgi:transglutaminase-like putative cysteine protease
LHQRVHQAIRYDRTYFNGTADKILQIGSGDCKAYSKVFAEAVKLMGLRAKVVRGVIAMNDGWYAHAWVTVQSSLGWTDWDPTSPEPFPDARYLRFTAPQQANSAFDGELGIFALDSIHTSQP